MPRSRTPVPIKPGQRVLIEAPFSEVCMHMRVAGKPMYVELVPSGAWGWIAQLYTPEGEPFSFPVLLAEAGVYGDRIEEMYVYPYQNAPVAGACW